MSLAPARNLACPIDGLALDTAAAPWRCPQGHSYDLAREGYANLLLVQHKASKDPGDSREMVAARSRFLAAGHFQPLSQRVFWMSASALEACAGRAAMVLDAGCGDGDHLARFAELCARHLPAQDVALAGIDISKWAVRAAARRQTPATWVVASNRRPPFLTGTVDLILCLFGFPSWEGFASVLAAQGHVLLADPGPDHLIELRRLIYPTVTQTAAPSLDAAKAAGFALEAEESLLHSITLPDRQTVQDLLLMTPHGARVPRDRREALAAIDSLEVTVDVTLRLLSAPATAPT